MYMNEPELTEYNTEDICNAYNEAQDIKVIARQYCMSNKEVREILKNNKES